MRAITRRCFLKQVICGVGGVVLAKSLGNQVSLAQAPIEGLSKVVITHHQEATDGVNTINRDIAQIMVDESIKEFTGKQSVADAWLSILPNYKKEHIIAIKVNAIQPECPTSPEVVDAVVKGLISAGVVDNNIIIYDNFEFKLRGCKYNYNTTNVGVRCFATDEPDWGYDWDNPVDILGQKKALSRILLKCDHLINIPVLKVHLYPYGVTLSLKNHYGSVENAQTLHTDFARACATLNSLSAIKDKTRIIIIDALFGFWGSKTTMFVRDFAPNTLIVSKDPVAADYIGTEMLNDELKRRNFPPRNVPLLAEAAKIGLGTDNPEEMEIIKLEVKGPEKPKDENGKSVNPQDKHIMQWGYIKKTNYDEIVKN